MQLVHKKNDIIKNRGMKMKICNDCNVEMINSKNLHTGYVGGVNFEEEIFLDYKNEEHGSKLLFSKEKYSKKRVMARVCPKCGKVELYVDLNDTN